MMARREEVIVVESEGDIVRVWQRVRTLAQEQGFDSFALTAITTAASELARNMWTHAGKGVVFIELLSQGLQSGLQLVFEDQGPGIPDVNKVMLGGYSTTKSLGLGLSGSKKLVDEFSIETSVGKGTKITLRKWKKRF